MYLETPYYTGFHCFTPIYSFYYAILRHIGNGICNTYANTPKTPHTAIMSTSILVQIKKKNSADLSVMIVIRGFFNSKPVASISTGQKILLKHWDSEKREVIAKAPNAKMINMVIQSTLMDMKKQLLKNEIMGEGVSRHQIIQAIKNKDESKDFIHFCNERIKEYSNTETVRTYTSEITKLQQFKKEVAFSELKYGFLAKYKAYMKQELKNKDNTVWKTFKFMNTFIRTAIKMKGFINENPFDEFDRGSYLQTKRKYLEISDCDKIETLINKNENGDLIRSIGIYFLLMAYSGMRFKDAMNFDPATHITNDGRLSMIYTKCNTEVNFKITDRLKRIIALLKTNPIKIGNQEFNRHLKTVAGLCKIKLNLTAHIGRHTMGGMLAELGIPEEQAMIILGQRDIRSTRIYYHVKPKNIDDAMQKMNTL